jgi:hypothetical protein
MCLIERHLWDVYMGQIQVPLSRVSLYIYMGQIKVLIRRASLCLYRGQIEVSL